MAATEYAGWFRIVGTRSTTTSGVPDIGRPQDAGPAGIDPNLRGSFRIIPRPRESTAMVEPSLWTFAGRSQPCHGFAERGGSQRTRRGTHVIRLLGPSGSLRGDRHYPAAVTSPVS